MTEKLSTGEVEERLASLEGWSLADGKLERQFKFPDFARAFGFMASAAIEADKLDHHPEWSNVYNKVKVHLVTHEAKGITDLDFQLARKMNELA
ncbi:MAG TPA: 4a-hydroxytetrahydrobiopterin dehydratase [Woeseiaceae bacterium]|nr:4a-hydroxytetrahydrobiopterin dehydratase [Woeseiaceae bacterium]